jgi:hypothetical protein
MGWERASPLKMTKYTKESKALRKLGIERKYLNIIKAILYMTNLQPALYLTVKN